MSHRSALIRDYPTRGRFFFSLCFFFHPTEDGCRTHYAKPDDFLRERVVAGLVEDKNAGVLNVLLSLCREKNIYVRVVNASRDY